MNKQIIFLIISTIVLISFFGCTQIDSLPGDNYVNLKLLIYSDEEIIFSEDQELLSGENAFEAVKILLDNNLEYQEYDFGVFITSILGKKPKEDEFWALYVNGEKATSGISSYEINENTLIEFKIEKLETY